MTLALLLTAVSGAWAADGVTIKELTVPAEWNNDDTFLTVDEMTGFKDCSSLTDDEAKALLNSVPTDKVIIFYGTGASSNSFKLVQKNWDQVAVGETPFFHGELFSLKDDNKIYYTAESDAIDVTPVAEPAANTLQWTFQMPASDVVLTPLYAPAAKWDVVESVEQLPAAIEGIIAGQDAAIVTAGQSAQGTVMYAVTTTAEAAPALTAFSATVPTAKDYDDAATVYVWYYIKGADTPDGQQATEENTFNDSEICATPLKVDILTNKFDITLTPANANTIEAGRATVTVGGTAATVTEGKLEAVKMGSEVKMTAKQGYKFRSVTAKKGGGLLSLQIGGLFTATIYYVEGETWKQAITNHPTENAGWALFDEGDVHYDDGNNGAFMFTNGNWTNGDTPIDPNASYAFEEL